MARLSVHRRIIPDLRTWNSLRLEIGLKECFKSGVELNFGPVETHQEGKIMNTTNRKPLPGTELDYFDTRSAVDAIQPGAYECLPYTSRVLAENLVRRCDPAVLSDSLKQIIW